MSPTYLKNRIKKRTYKTMIAIGCTIAAFFLLLQLIGSAASGIIAILAWQYDQCEQLAESSSEDIGDIDVGKYSKDMVSMAHAVAEAVGKKLGIDPSFIFGQMYQETGFNAKGSTALKDNNLSGIKYSPSMSDYATAGGGVGNDGSGGGQYAHFKSLSAYASFYAKTLSNMLKGAKPKTVEDFVNKIAAAHYFGSYHGGSFYASASEKAAYVAGMKTGIALYKKTNKSSGSDSNSSSSSQTKKKTRDDNRTLTKSKKVSYIVNNKLPVKPVDIDSDSSFSNTFKISEGEITYLPAPTGKSKIVTISNDGLDKLFEKQNIGDQTSKQVRDQYNTSGTPLWTNDKYNDNHYNNKGTSTIEKINKKIEDKNNKKDANGKSFNDYVGAGEDHAIDDQKNICAALGFDFDNDEGEVSGEWTWPFAGLNAKNIYQKVTGPQLFGHTGGGRTNGYHDGIDLGTAQFNGQKIRAIHGGKVVEIGFKGHTQNDLGGYVVVKGDGYYIVYQEFVFNESEKNKAIKVKVGQSVKAGQTIGILSSSTSNVNHVHIGITKKPFSEAVQHSFDPSGGWVDPIKLIKEGMKNSKSSSSPLHLSADEEEARKWIIQRESSGSYTAKNGQYYGAYQLKKSYLTDKTYGGDGSLSKKNQDYVAQKYMESRYHTWVNAKKHWQSSHWW